MEISALEAASATDTSSSALRGASCVAGIPAAASLDAAAPIQLGQGDFPCASAAGTVVKCAFSMPEQSGAAW